MSVGERLREAREKKQLSVEDVSRRTKIQSKFLIAIDNDDFASLPSSHYKFFVRDYARAVDLDSDEILSEVPAPAPVKVFTDPDVEEGATRRPTFIEGANSRRPRYSPVNLANPNTANLAIGGAILLIIALGIYYFAGGFDSSDEGRSYTEELATDSSAGSRTEIIPRPGEDEGDTEEASTYEPGDSLTLEGRAIDRVWYSIVMDGKRSDTETIDSGQVRTWRAAELFKLSLGNAGGLELYLNGKTLGTLGPRSTVVRNQVIDMNGLRERRSRRSTSTSSSGSAN